MPAFTFEKISPPVRRMASASQQPNSVQSRGLIVQLLDRFVLVRVKRRLNGDDRGDSGLERRKLPD